MKASTGMRMGVRRLCGLMISVLFGAAAVSYAAEASAVPERYGVDDAEVLGLKQRYPSAFTKLTEGEALLARSPSRADVERAATLFAEAEREVPENTLLARRTCQALTALGKRDLAVEACGRALKNRVNSALAIRAMVGALMSGPDAPSIGDVGRATFYAQRVKHLMSNDPWGLAAECDVAAKLGDTEMLNRCTNELRALAPEHYETKRMESIVASLRPGWKTWLGNLAVLALVVGTALHALFRRRARAATTAAVALCATSLLGATVARAEDTDDAAPARTATPPDSEGRPRVAGSLSKYAIDDLNPMASVPTPEQRDKDPLEYGYFLMDLGDHAEAAIKNGDHLKAANLYRAMAKAVPDTAISFRKACEQFELAKDLDKAAEYCAAALALNGAKLTDYQRYAGVVMAKDGAPTQKDIANLDKAIGHLKESEETKLVGFEIQCTLGFRLGDAGRLKQCAPELATLAPESPRTTFFQWALALNEKEYAAAERFLATARSAEKAGNGVGRAQLARMEKATVDATPVWRKGFRDWRLGAALALALFAGLGVLVTKRRATAPRDASATSG